MQQIKQIDKYSDKQEEYMKLTIIDISRLLEEVSNTLKEKLKKTFQLFSFPTIIFLFIFLLIFPLLLNICMYLFY